MGKTFKVIKSILSPGNQTNFIKNIDFIINDQLVCDNVIIANKFNDYFVNVGSSLANCIHSNVNPLSYVINNVNSIVVPDMSQADVLSVILSLKDSASGYDNLPASILKQCVSEYIAPLTYLINSSFSQGIFPDDLKIAKVLPIFKAGNEQLISNYRPNSVIPFFSKVMEKIIANIIIDFLDKSNIFYDQQFGFRKITQQIML